jgi:hypothetical protein
MLKQGTSNIVEHSAAKMHVIVFQWYLASLQVSKSLSIPKAAWKENILGTKA